MSHGRFQSRPHRPQRAPRARSNAAAAISTINGTMTLWPDAPAADIACGPDIPAVLGRIGPPTPVSAADWHDRGIEQEVAGDFDAAIRSYTRALAVGGPDAQTAFDLAFALTQVGDATRAVARYREAVQLDPLRADAWINLGDLLADDEQTDVAIECFRHAIELNTADAVAYYNLATVLDDAGETERATLYWAMFVELTPDLPQHLAYAKTHLALSPGTLGEGLRTVMQPDARPHPNPLP